MLLEYMEDPDAQVQTRVLLLYELMPSQVATLRDALGRLSRGNPSNELRVDTLPGIVAVDGPSLLATVGEADFGVEPVAGAGRHFRCVLTPGAWQRACGLLEPFLIAGRQGFQYLSEEGAVEWIISHHRGW
jgi:hypothetical protein